MDQQTIDRIKNMAAEARLLAAEDHVMVRVAGERIAALLADLLFEIDIDLDDVTPFLPAYRRDASYP